jgi:hypothetical protein
MDPEDVRARLAPYYTRLRAELERFGGTVEKFIGDAVVALFGAPIAHEDDPERAVRAALAIRDAIEELNAEDEWLDLKIRIGVNTGEALVVVGAKASEGEGMADRLCRDRADRREGQVRARSGLAGRKGDRCDRAARFHDVPRRPAARGQRTARALGHRRTRAAAGSGDDRRRSRHRQEPLARRARRPRRRHG